MKSANLEFRKSDLEKIAEVLTLLRKKLSNFLQIWDRGCVRTLEDFAEVLPDK